MNRLLAGTILLIVCNLFYIAWWMVAFKPTIKMRASWPAGLLVGAATVIGLVAVFMMVNYMKDAQTVRRIFSGPGLIIGGLVAYVALLLFTFFKLHRQVTLELLLIVGWVVLVWTAINTLYGMERINLAASIILILSVLTAAIVIMIFYMKYYTLDEAAGFTCGLIPLIITAGVTGVFAVIEAIVL